MSIQMATRILHVKDGNSYDTIDILRGAKGESPDIDDALSDVSENPVQNKVIKEALDDKVDVESGKGLSTNDFTTTLKDKLTKTNVTYCTCATSGSTATKVVSIASGANTTFNFYVGAIVAVKFTYSNTAQNPKLNVNNTGAKPVRANGNQITTTYLSYAGYANRTILYMYNGVEWTFLGWDTDSTATYSDATQSQHGLMSAADKTKLDGIETGANKTVVDDALDGESTNPVQNAVVTEAIDDVVIISEQQPSVDTNKIWIDDDEGTIAIPTMTEFNALSADLSGLSSSIAPVESSATATAAHAVGELFMMGETLMVALSAIAIGDTITTEGGSPNAAVTKLSDKLIKDVQINGSSILNNGVANVPVATSSVLGAVKVDANNGIGIESQNKLYLNYAESNIIKSGTGNYRPISPPRQHESTFYGLAKASGDTSQSASSNPVGTYTETAKQKINAMLEPQFRTIKTVTITENTRKVYIIADEQNNPLLLTEIIVRFENIIGSGAGNGAVSVNSGNNPTGDGSNGTFVNVPALYNTSTAQSRIAHINVSGGRMIGDSTAANDTNSYTDIYMKTNRNARGLKECGKITEICIGSMNSYDMTSGTITIYGR